MNRSSVLALVLAGLFLSAHPARPASAAQQPRKGLFSPLNLGVLEGADREQWNKPEQIMDALKIAEGSQVAEIGAGGGWFTVRLAHRVSQSGVVYAEDVQAEMIAAWLVFRFVQRRTAGIVHGQHA